MLEQEKKWFSAALVVIACLSVPVHSIAMDFGANARSAIDVSTRAYHMDSQTWTQAAIGFDLHRVFTGSQGDIGTLILQPYAVRVDDPPVVPGIFDDQHDWALQWRIANFNYTALGRGRFNVRVGHFELPFGLEQVEQTNGTLYQVQTPAGLKADWGMSINGQTQLLEYEIAYMTGSGNDLDIDSSSIVVGRVGTPSYRAAWAGLSYMHGKQQASIEPVDRRRWGLDAGLLLPLGLSLRGEYVNARKPDQPADHVYAELRWQHPRESIHLYSQWRQARTELVSGSSETQTLTLGVRYEPSRWWSASVAARHGLLGDVPSNQITIQLRYRFQDVL